MLNSALNSLLFLLIVMLSSQVIAATDTQKNIVASVNGKTISHQKALRYAQMRLGLSPDQAIPTDKKQQLLDELINRELIYQEAIKTGFDKSPHVLTDIAEQTHSVITQSRIRKLLEQDRPATPEQLQTAYQQQIVSPASVEYQASHILLESENDAKAIIAELDAGKNFAELAKQKSTGPSSIEGGRLGWFSPDQMVKPFSDATAKLNQDQYTKQPVKTQFGWHVILLTDMRKLDPPPFSQVEKQLRNAVNNQILSTYIDELKKTSKIDRNAEF